MYLYNYDANGNVGQVVDSSDGSLKARYEYDPFGNALVAEGGLHYYGYRYYSAELGRWISRDPIEESGGINLYGFVFNNTINLCDILGLAYVKWKNFPDDKEGHDNKQFIRSSLGKALSMIKKSYEHMDMLRKRAESGLNIPVPKLSPVYKRWFGGDKFNMGDVNSIKVKKQFEQMDAAVQGTITFDACPYLKTCLEKESRLMYVDKEESDLVIYICTAYWMLDDISAAVTIVHEISHKAGFQTFDYKYKNQDVYGEELSKKLKNNEPNDAVQSAENYGYFARDVYLNK